MRATFISALFILFSSALSPALKADVFSLKYALKHAVELDPRMRERKQIVNVARAMELETRGVSDVSFDINFFVGLAPKKSGDLLTTDKNGQRVSRSDTHNYEGIAPWYNLRLDIVKPLYSFGKSESYTAAAKKNVTARQREVNLVKTKIKYDVYNAYYNYLAARDSRLMLKDISNRLEKAIALVEKWLRKGGSNAKQSDVFALQTGAARVNRYLAQTLGAEKISLNRLKTLTGVGLSQKLEVRDKRIEPVKLPKHSLKKLQRKALANRPQLTQLRTGLNARRRLVRANHSNTKPDIYTALIGSFATRPGRTNLDNPLLFDRYNHIDATPMIGLQWDWDNGRQTSQIMQAQAALDRPVETSVFMQQGIPLQVAEQYQLVHTHYTMVEELARGSRAGRRWMIASYADFEAGLERSEKIMIAFQGYVQVHTDYLKAVNDYNMHVIRLKSVTGEL